MKKLISKLAVIIMCVIVSCMSLGTGIVANAASDDPSTIAKNVSLPANNKAVKATITLTKTNTYTISYAVIDSRYTTAKINGKAYQVYFQDNAMYVVGDVTNDTFFKNMANEQIAKLTVVR